MLETQTACEACDQEMQIFDSATTEEYDGSAIDIKGQMWVEWTVEDCETATFAVCVDCLTFVASCNSCDQRMLFVGHQGFAEDGGVYERSAKTGKQQLTSKRVNPDKPRFEVEDLNKHKFNTTTWYPRGPNGDMKHFWRCEECEYSASFGGLA